MISVHNVPYALQRIRNIFKQQIPRAPCFNQTGNFKEESTSCIVKSPAAASERKCLAGESSTEQVEAGQVAGVDFSCIGIVSLLLSDFMDSAVACVGVFIDLTVADTLETARTGQPGPETADPREHIKIADQVISPSSCCRASRKPRTFSSTSPACGRSDFSFSATNSMLCSSSRTIPRMLSNSVSRLRLSQIIRHTVSVRCPAGMARRMFHASRWWGAARLRERLSLRFSVICTTGQHLPRKPFIPFGVQTYIIQEQRPAQALRGGNVAFHQRRSAAQEDSGHGTHIQAAFCDG